MRDEQLGEGEAATWETRRDSVPFAVAPGKASEDRCVVHPAEPRETCPHCSGMEVRRG
jgi:hypothetical protein